MNTSDKRAWKTGMWMVIVILACTAVCCLGAGIATGWAAWH